MAAGGRLTGEGLDGPDMDLAETVAGPTQTLMRVGADPEAVLEMLTARAPDRATPQAAGGLHEAMRNLSGHWKATPYGGDMILTWPDR